ncbi:finger Xfin-like isoform X2 [Octopus vulgaris]|uniref:Finger Xfin-like isoform X2 n=1 Tax=Octopus vulgaris TaxID=6645 RepID=A0AA36BSW4_OCTVU|nr:finger Xfin-like isoform X2 [Octopus vulgaris]
MSSGCTNYVVSETTEILIDLGPMKDTVHQVSGQPGCSLLTSMYAQKISPKIVQVCFICDKMFINRVSLTKHLTKHNILVRGATSSVNEGGSNATNRDLEKLNPPGKISCEYCRGLFDNQDDLMKHENTHYLFEGSVMEKHCCGYCGVKFSRRRDLFRHIRCCGTLSAVDNCKLATEINMKPNSNKQSDESSQASTQVEYFCLNCKQKRSFKILSLDRASKLLKLNCQTCGKPLHLTYFASESSKAKDPQKTVDCDTTAEPCQDNGLSTSTPQSPLLIDDNDPVADDEEPCDQTPVNDDEEPRDQTPVNDDEEPRDQTPVNDDEEPRDQTPVTNDKKPRDQTPVTNDKKPRDQTPVTNDRKATSKCCKQVRFSLEPLWVFDTGWGKEGGREESVRRNRRRRERKKKKKEGEGEEEEEEEGGGGEEEEGEEEEEEEEEGGEEESGARRERGGVESTTRHRMAGQEWALPAKESQWSGGLLCEG